MITKIPDKWLDKSPLAIYS